MNTSSNILRKKDSYHVAAILALLILVAQRADATRDFVTFPHSDPLSASISLAHTPHYLSKPTPGPAPEHYIAPTLKHGLKLALPEPISRGLELDAGYDRRAGLPTFTADYFLPIRAWNDKSLFLSPRCSLGGRMESFSVGAGLRTLVHGDAAVGFYAFHDWVRSRGSWSEFLKEVGIGAELSALPGRYSDLTLSANAYFPVNERLTPTGDGELLVREALPRGGDLRVAFLLPGIVDSLDIRIKAQTHAYRGEKTDLAGYSLGLTLNTRDGMFSTTAEEGRDSYLGDYFRVEGSVRLAFDWQDLVQGKMPFSAPYKAPEKRFARDLRHSLVERVVRKHDLPTDKSEKRMALAAAVSDDTVSVSGGFPGLPHTTVSLQTAMSPWRDRMELTTDSYGCYRGRLRLPPGTYRVRLVHKPSGRVSEVRTVTVSSGREEE